MKWKVDEEECAKDVLERKKKFIEMNKPKRSFLHNELYSFSQRSQRR